VGPRRDLVEGEVARVVPRERGDASDGELRGVVEVVDDDGAESREEELQHGVAADVARPARDEHGPPGIRAGQRLLHRHGTWLLLLLLLPLSPPAEATHARGTGLRPPPRPEREGARI